MQQDSHLYNLIFLRKENAKLLHRDRLVARPPIPGKHIERRTQSSRCRLGVFDLTAQVQMGELRQNDAEMVHGRREIAVNGWLVQSQPLWEALWIGD